MTEGNANNFDVSFSFATSITTSDNPDLAGQASDIILGGGAQLRFLLATEIFASAVGEQLCLSGKTTTQFLPEHITTFVNTVFEIETIMTRLSGLLDTAEMSQEEREDVMQQIENWDVVLSNYRQTTVATHTESVAVHIDGLLEGMHKRFEDFLAEPAARAERGSRGAVATLATRPLARGVGATAPRRRRDRPVASGRMCERAGRPRTILDRTRTRTRSTSSSRTA